jgi:hypothetical protein
MLVFAHVGIAVGLFMAFLFVTRTPIVKFDIRLLFIGAMLPDIIDKPLNMAGLWAGRGVAHTLLFLVLLFIATLYARRTILSFGAGVHVLLDEMYLYPKLALWPVYGWEIHSPPYNPAFYLNILMNNVFVQRTEFLGIMLIAIFAAYYRLYEPARLKKALLTGVVTERIQQSW